MFLDITESQRNIQFILMAFKQRKKLLRARRDDVKSFYAFRTTGARVKLFA